MKRRTFFKAGAAATAALASTSLLANTPRKLRLASSWPKNFPGIGTGVERIAERIKVLSNGTINVQVYAAGELVPSLEVMDAVSAGSAHMGHTSSYYAIGKNPAFNFFATIPFGMTANEHYAWIRYGGGQQLWDELGAEFGVKPLLAGNTGPQMGGWFVKKIDDAEDLQGLRLRYPGLGGELLRHLGATPVNIPGGELFTALQSGTVDGVEWISPWNDLAFGLQRVCKHYYYPGFHEPGHGFALYINLELWNSFSKEEQAIIAAAAEVENSAMLGEYNAHNQSSLEQLIKEHEVQTHKWPEDILSRLAAIVDDVIADDAARDPFAKKVYESWKSFLDSQKQWAETADIPYLAIRK
ncbi:TRAP transporter substrate-binding protein [Motiliproteus sp. MSK22-1]|uniref:TRAP transporter substrate-binding protein n=1 Tax=Motiliproteus sp. MSK22-1 TaxID=1897630 RepID=UPI0009776C0C|nr:TRAP transporter substrate-binding protein [Motiliproteus sp. MSK22-1]OMH36223.1 ABC transporter substrate-binding protein [Motiliproteus sp. MSK22-1]